MALTSTQALAIDAGQINFYGLVSDETCEVTASSAKTGSNPQDVDVRLDTAKISDITDVVANTTAGAKPEDFRLVVDCKNSTATGTKVDLAMTSTLNTTVGTLAHNGAASVGGLTPAGNVAIAVHDKTGGAALKQVLIGNPSDIHSATLDADKKATFDFVASYVKQNAGTAVTSGPIVSHATYTYSYN